MKFTRALCALIALCTVIALSPAVSARTFDDTSNYLRDDGGEIIGGGGGGGVDPTPQPQPDPTPQPEPPVDQGGGSAGGAVPPINPLPEVLEGFVQNAVKAATVTLDLVAVTLQNFVAGSGGRLNVDVNDVLVNEYPAMCRWLDNTGETDIFVPFATSAEWEAFVDFAPVSITRTACCPATTLNLTASDGQFLEVNLPIGRVGSTGLAGQRQVSQAFNLTRLDGGVVRETLTATYNCTASGWTLGNTNTTSEVISEPDGPVVEDPTSPPVACTDPTVPTVKNMVATWTGTYRRSARSNTTYSMSGFSSVRHMYMNDGVQTSNGSGDRSTAVFKLKKLAKNTHVKVTALYGSYGGTPADGSPGPFSNGVTPKVAEFDIVDGVPVTKYNTPQTLVFHSLYRMGHPFRMENDEVFMPAYDSSPNLLSLKVEYTYEEFCKPPVDAIVFGETCANTGGRYTCLSNGTNCVTPINSAATITMDPTAHAGTFCSSVSNTDSGSDGATVVFDLRDQLEGRSGSAAVVIPYDAWFGLRDQTTARAVMADPDSYQSLPQRPGIGLQQSAIKFLIPDVDVDTSTGLITQRLDSGCGKDCHNNHHYKVDYNASSKSLTVLMYKNGRWKKNLYPACTGGNWNNQYKAGTCNGKVWSEVRVVAPAPATCGSAVSTVHMSYGMNSTDLCTVGTPSEVSQTVDTTGNAPAGFYNWTCTGETTTATCQAAYSDYIDFGGLPF